MYLPGCVTINIYRKYKAVITILIPIRIIVMFVREKDAIGTSNSPIQLTVGARVAFIRLAGNHQVAIHGRNICRRPVRI